eukprot:3183083-Pyramimonas_sp.AAC.1
MQLYPRGCPCLHARRGGIVQVFVTWPSGLAGCHKHGAGSARWRLLWHGHRLALAADACGSL